MIFKEGHHTARLRRKENFWKRQVRNQLSPVPEEETLLTLLVQASVSPTHPGQVERVMHTWRNIHGSGPN